MAKAAKSVKARLLVGGRALTPEVRRKLNPADVCETMSQLEQRARSLRGKRG